MSHEPILSDDEVNRIRQGATTKAAKKKAALEASVKYHTERLRKLALIQPEVYSWGMSFPEYRAMMKAETKLVREAREKRRAEKRNRIRTPGNEGSG